MTVEFAAMNPSRNRCRACPSQGESLAPAAWLRARQRGQAMTEFLLVAGFASTALFALPAISNYGTTRMQAVSAAKLVAWQRTAWLPEAIDAKDALGVAGAIRKDDAEITRDVVRHVFRDRRTATGTLHAPEMAEFEPGQPPVAQHTAVSVRTTVVTPPSVLDATDAVLDGVGKAQALLKDNSLTRSMSNFRLMSGGYLRNEVSVSREMPGFALWPKAQMSAQVTMLTEPWNAGGTNREETKVQGLVPLKMADSKPLQIARTTLLLLSRTIVYFFPTFDMKKLEIGLNPGRAEEKSPLDRHELQPEGADRFRYYRSFPPAPVVQSMP